MPLANQDLLQLGEYELDRSQWRLSWMEEPIALNRKTFDLLLYLADNSERVVGKQELMEALWPEQFIEESNLTQHIFLLRKALSRHDSAEKMIETVPGRGYRLAVAVTKAEPMAGSVVFSAKESITRVTFEEEQSEDELQPVREMARVERALRIVLIALAAVTAFAVGSYGWQRWQDGTGGAPVRILLMPLDGTTGDAVLDRSLLNVLRMNLAQSPFVSILTDATVSETLAQMKRDSHDPLNLATAREVCERTNSQAVLHGSIARNGRHYLLTEEATDCVDGKTIAEGKDEANEAEELPHSIETLGKKLRKGMGESRRSITRFDTPLFHGDNTASLDALKAYTLGTEQMRLGHIPEAIGLFKTSLAYDPNFAVAQYGLAAGYRNVGDDQDSRAAEAAAYRLKDTASKPIQFLISAAYLQSNTQDLYESIRNDQNWVNLYPNAPIAWDRLAGVQRDLGRYADSVQNSKRALLLFPRSSSIVVNHATGLFQSRDFNGARATLEQAVSSGVDGDWIRIRFLELAYLQQDKALIQQQRDWLADHPDAVPVLLGEARIAVAEGRFDDARDLALKCSEISRQHGVSAAGDRFLHTIAVELMEAGDVAAGKRLFQSAPIDVEEGQDLVGLVYMGDVDRAKAELNAMLTKYPRGTLWNLYWEPQVMAAIAMQEGRPQDAALILEKARPVEMRELTVPWLRGTAYLAAGKAATAEKDFREVTEHPEVDPTAFEIRLAWLGLGRSLAAMHDGAGAIVAYRHFVDAWGNAASDADVLRQAKEELRQLEANRQLP